MKVSKFKDQNCCSALVNDQITIAQCRFILKDRIGAFLFSVFVLYHFSAVISPVLCSSNWKVSHGIRSIIIPMGPSY